MSKERYIFIIGIIIIILPYLGFPNSWRKFFFTIIGLCLAYLAYQIRGAGKSKDARTEIRTGTFTENQSNQ